MRLLTTLALVAALGLPGCGDGLPGQEPADAFWAADAQSEVAGGHQTSPVDGATPVPSPSRTAAPAPASRGIAPPTIAAAAVIVVDETSGATLFAQNPRELLAQASLTKMATAVVVLEHGRLDDVVTAAPDINRYLLDDSSTVGLLPGDVISVRDLVYGLLLVSGNDAADAAALATAGSNDAFVARMNGLATRLGMGDTHFTDPHGLGGPGHYSSAQDLALLSRHAMTFPEFREIVGTEEYLVKANRDLPLYNQNPLLNYTPGVDGIKTGYTESAGRTFSLSATRDNHRVYIVMLNAPLRTQDAIALLEWTFANHDWGSPGGPRE